MAAIHFSDPSMTRTASTKALATFALRPSRAQSSGWQAVRRFSKNAAGTDFVVGDIHGAFDLVVAAMRAARFNPSCDRLFVVGDMVDRGAESIRALRFLKQPYVHAIRGNHEQAWLDLYKNGTPEEAVVHATSSALGLGGRWWLDANPADRDALVDEFRNLPLAIEVETERGLVGLIHADVPEGVSWQQFIGALECADKKAIETALWSRKRIRRDDSSGVPGIDRLFVGHDPQFTGTKRLGNVYYIDTGAIFGMQASGQEPGHLTLAALTASTGALTNAVDYLSKSGLVDLRVEQPPAGGACQ